MSRSQVDEWLHSDKGSPWRHRDTGGGILPAAQMAMQGSIASQDPLTANFYKQLQGYPTEKLRELQVRVPPTSVQGQLISRAIQARQMQPQGSAQAMPQTPIVNAAAAVPQQAPATAQAVRSGGSIIPKRANGGILGELTGMGNENSMWGSLFGDIGSMFGLGGGAENTMKEVGSYVGPLIEMGAMAAFDRGGATPKRDAGGPLGMSVSMASPWWERSEEYDMGSSSGGGSGLLHGTTFGRADHVTTSVPGGGYVLPADVVSGLGEGNTLAGAAVIDRMLHSGPHGVPMPRMGRGPGPPRPIAARAPTPRSYYKAGGVPDQPGHVPVKLSDGEYFIHPMDVRRLGAKALEQMGKRGDTLATGHKVLDALILYERKRLRDKLAKLPGPVKAAA